MADTTIYRPGAILGSYPQREDERLSGLDRFFAGVGGWVRKRLTGLGLGRQRFLTRVHAEEKGLERLVDIALRSEIRSVKEDLQLHGLTEPLMARAFALIRETASRTLGMRHFDVQLLGGRIMLSGRLAEMDTGEGKTLTATLAAATAALAGMPVHVVTVNDFLAERDAAWMGPLYRAMGLSVGVILEGMELEQRRTAYASDITYCTNKQLAFDYLKDRIILDSETRQLHLRIEGLTAEKPRTDRVLMRGLCFAIVDEADSVLVDEARTPLVISRKSDNSAMEQTYVRAVSLARWMRHPEDFTVRTAERRIDLTASGKEALRERSETLGGVWAADVHREDLVRQALTALHLYERDKHYIVRQGRIEIVDEYTGRVMGDRSWERGLHQMIEIKEEVEVTGRHETLARISYQRFFRRYLLLAGMTGTAREVAGELWSVYNLGVSRVPPNKASRRTIHQCRFFAREDQKWQAVADRIEALNRTGRPVLVGTRHVHASETLSRLLVERGLEHQVLNARQNDTEAEIVARAGQRGQITVATNMAGRGTDIKLANGVEELGGLFVLGTELHDSGRIDRQLFGRCGRQGDRGETQMYLSLEDEIVTAAFGSRLEWLAARLDGGKGRIPRLIAGPLFWMAQAAAERRNAVIRKALLRHDDSLEDLLAFTGRTE